MERLVLERLINYKCTGFDPKQCQKEEKREKRSTGKVKK
jgi:hypothetical protein